jgi:hypothetical protein
MHYIYIKPKNLIVMKNSIKKFEAKEVKNASIVKGGRDRTRITRNARY